MTPKTPATTADGPVTFSKVWRFPAGAGPALSAYACDFARPFWAAFSVDGDTRTIEVPGLDPAHPDAVSTLVETLTDRTDSAYGYDQRGFPGMDRYAGRLACHASPAHTTLIWTCTFSSDHPGTVARCLALLASSVDVMTRKLAGAPGLAP